MSLLAVNALEAGYGPVRVLHGISLEVDAGQVVALLGRNGAGKTTTLKAIAGLAHIFAGEVTYSGRNLAKLATYRRAQMGLGYVPEDRRIFPELTVRENLEVAARPGPWNLERTYNLMPWLKEIERRRGGFLSGGEQQMLAIARTMMGNPELLLVDEPSEGLAPHFVRLVRELVLELKHAGVAVLLAEQNLPFITRVADHVYVLESGELRLQGAIDQLAQNREVRRLLAL